MSLSTRFKIKLGASVKLSLSGEKGAVVGRAEYSDHPPSYQVRYVAANGCQTVAWLDFAELVVEAEG